MDESSFGAGKALEVQVDAAPIVSQTSLSEKGECSMSEGKKHTREVFQTEHDVVFMR